MQPNVITTLGWSNGCLTVTDPAVVEVFLEALTQIRQNAVITILSDGRLEERALVHGIARRIWPWSASPSRASQGAQLSSVKS